MSRPIELSQNRKLTVPLAFVAAVIAATYAFAMGYSRLTESDVQQSSQISANTRQLADHEARLRTLESVNARIDQKLDRLLEIERQQSRLPASR